MRNKWHRAMNGDIVTSNNLHVNFLFNPVDQCRCFEWQIESKIKRLNDILFFSRLVFYLHTRKFFWNKPFDMDGVQSVYMNEFRLTKCNKKCKRIFDIQSVLCVCDMYWLIPISYIPEKGINFKPFILSFCLCYSTCFLAYCRLICFIRERKLNTI